MPRTVLQNCRVIAHQFVIKQLFSTEVKLDIGSWDTGFVLTRDDHSTSRSKEAKLAGTAPCCKPTAAHLQFALDSRPRLREVCVQGQAWRVGALEVESRHRGFPPTVSSGKMGVQYRSRALIALGPESALHDGRHEKQAAGREVHNMITPAKAGELTEPQSR